MATETADNNKLEKAIEELKKIPNKKEYKVEIRGKWYATVNSRNHIFRKNFGLDVSYHSSYELTEPKVFSYKNNKGELIEKFIPGSVIVKTEIFYKNKFLTCGLAQEFRDSNPVNTTSAMENCQTSSLGRALAMLDLTGTEFASADEMQIMENNKGVVDSTNNNDASDTSEENNNHIPPISENDQSSEVSLSDFTMISNAIDGSKHLGQLRSIYTKFKNEIDNNEQLQGVYKNHEEKINRNKPKDDGWDI